MSLLLGHYFIMVLYCHFIFPAMPSVQKEQGEKPNSFDDSFGLTITHLKSLGAVTI